MTESTQPELDPLRLQPHTHQPSAASTASGPIGNIGSNHARASGEKRMVDTQKLETDTTSDKATAAFIRRTLCSNNVLLGNGEKGGTAPRPIDELLPPLTSSNEVDLQLYGIISVIIKEFVQTWYSKMTPDHVFVNEVIQVIAHCTRALEQRIRKVDLEALLLDEIPGLLEEHLTAFRLAKQQASSPQSLVSDPRLIYHTLYPHPALSPVPIDAVPSTHVEQRESESAWRQLIIQGVLAVLLPTDDLKNGCLRSLVAEIFAEMILGNGISGKACEGWLLLEAIGRIADILQTDHLGEEDPSSSERAADEDLSRLERFGLLPSQAEEGSGPTKLPVVDGGRHESTATSASGLFWLVVQYAFLACTALRAVILTIATSSSLPSRSLASGPTPIEESRQSHLPEAEYQASTRLLAAKRPILSMKLWSCAAQFVELDVRMPWLTGFVSILHCGALFGPGRVGDTDGVLDRFLSNIIHTRILNPALLPVVLRTVRATLFPNNGMGPPRLIPNEEETKEIKHRCAASLLGLLPPKVAAAFFASDNRVAQHQQVEEILDCLEDTYLNKHLIFQILELVVLRLAPELGQQGVRDLMEDRIG
ncbi:uncharacterized protein EKO05_0003506 [Ascochyta rabiei]|uniref:Uncharacterized protein n=1 Tax=Didymella rabiei TaxID=5454 RepID=A0A163GEG8_DIDRA|nr:uncharacterized protein EKO05_0003506 [Ascochyta rabiei]KZM24817.1 hypothetical protein ST47_g4042 [Ascochyta rabiei]UPX12976.1 hypothetical protein EKO05_0003506 [Ascochyta rabiei]